jgi:murein DD-endopeptidase MepM/ murein hydrolase activator NlpD
LLLQYLNRVVTVLNVRGLAGRLGVRRHLLKLFDTSPTRVLAKRGRMIGNLWERGTSRLPEVRSVIQGARHALGLIQTQRAYAIAASAVGITVVAVTFAGIGYVRHARHADDAELAANRIETANIDLQDELARLRDKIAASNRDLAAAQARVVALAEEERARAQHDEHQVGATEQTTTAKGDKLTQLTTALHQAEAQRATLAARLSKAEADLSQQQAKQSELQAELDQWQKKLQLLTADHDKAVSERDRLRARVGELEKQSELRHSAASVASLAPAVSSVAPVAAASVAAQAPAAEAPQRVAGILNAPAPAATAQPVAAVAGVSSVAHGAVDQFARVLASAGVDVRHLFDEFGVNRDAGGPFIPAPRGQTVTTALSPERLAAMIKSLPVAAPLTNFEVSSPFGVREDPENGRGAFHTGIDLRAPYDTPVYATAPGTVTFAGWRDDYGKIVEIDHGNGIATRYAHLHAFTVSVGQRVAVRQQVGYLGSSGRATGPHVHYEVVVNGEPQDPEKFFGLARYVPSMTVPVAARN